MNKISSIVTILLTIIAFSASGETINLECQYDYINTANFEHLINDLGKTNSILVNTLRNKQWWQFWAYDKSYEFSIDLENRKITTAILGSDAPSHTVDIYTDEFIINGYFQNSETQQIQHATEFFIQRSNGDMTGEIYVLDNYFEPYYKPGDTIPFIGNCKPLNNLF